MNRTTEAEVFVVGGSAAGLVVVRALEQRGLEATVLEAEESTAVGWRTACGRAFISADCALPVDS